eukprot:CAMPEP_0113300184 /NCGR_PEP_ID=MMETSP0010_2-20120614/1921_1 /TAXON_ID=216773 ORGANISM="Corethron hystrix, Strain 308" /NCGR_SAMPLE_ID=MMETSP0010_2 /ASSEMBLY_ACC=CAM_ASM_000155 /LENGTH=67 /DNA_ID=CAMNT_0000153569 /DNA_START=116 /DNA_END=319 /DNA_ORIENTATION=+ /assembly_acc=CAM_ASM_000155
MTAATTYWRLAGLSYVQFLNRATSTLRASLKEPARSKAAANDSYSYSRNVWEAGKPTQKAIVESISK